MMDYFWTHLQGRDRDVLKNDTSFLRVQLLAGEDVFWNKKPQQQDGEPITQQPESQMPINVYV